MSEDSGKVSIPYSRSLYRSGRNILNCVSELLLVPMIELMDKEFSCCIQPFFYLLIPVSLQENESTVMVLLLLLFSQISHSSSVYVIFSFKDNGFRSRIP